MGEKISGLFAEGERDLSAAICRLLTKKGCNVDVVNDGVQAYTRFSAKHYDLLIADRKMPRMPVKEVVDSFKKISGASVIILSDKAKEKLREDETVGDSLLFMPFSENTLLSAIRDVTGIDLL